MSRKYNLCLTETERKIVNIWQIKTLDKTSVGILITETEHHDRIKDVYKRYDTISIQNKETLYEINKIYDYVFKSFKNDGYMLSKRYNGDINVTNNFYKSLSEALKEATKYKR